MYDPGSRRRKFAALSIFAAVFFIALGGPLLSAAGKDPGQKPGAYLSPERRLELASLRSSGPDEIVFFVASDPHYGASVSTASANARTVEAMNALPGTRFPKKLGSSVVAAPRGVVVLGDLVNEGNRPEAAARWAEFCADYGLTGEGRLAFPVFEGVGNHDGDPGRPVREGVRSRNLRRPGLAAVSPDGLHYSWDWGDVHFVQLNLFAGTSGDDVINPWGRTFQGQWRYPRHSLEFLVKDLAEHVGSSGRRVVLFQHYGWDEWSLGWWSDAERQALAKALAGYHPIAIFWGHSHIVRRLDWNGIPTWCVGSVNQELGGGEFVVVRIGRGEMDVAARKGSRWGKSERVSLRRVD